MSYSYFFKREKGNYKTVASVIERQKHKVEIKELTEVVFLALNLFICEVWKPGSVLSECKQNKSSFLASVPALYEEQWRSCIEKITLCKLNQRIWESAACLFVPLFVFQRLMHTEQTSIHNVFNPTVIYPHLYKAINNLAVFSIKQDVAERAVIFCH